MPNYIQKALKHFNIPYPSKPIYAPYYFTENKLNNQSLIILSDDLILLPKEIKLIQQIISILLFYTRAVDSTLVETLNDLLSNQTKATKPLIDKLIHLL